MFKITLAEGYSPTTMLVVATVAVALAAAFYYRAFGVLRPLRWQALLALRVVAILVVVLLLFRPVFSYYREIQDRPAIIFLVDTSASMSIADSSGGLTRLDQARVEVEKWSEKLREAFDLRWIEFAEQARPLSGIEELRQLQPVGKSTSLSTALKTAAKQLPRRNVEAIVMLSDGIHNAAGNPSDVTPKLGFVVHTVGVGTNLRNDASHRDVQVTGIDCPERMMLNNLARITGSVQSLGLEGRVVKVLLEEDDRQVAESELALGPPGGVQRVTFDFRPATKGRHNYTVRVPVLPEEKIKENNQRSAPALVSEPGIRVLYIEGTLRAEYGAIVDRFLAKDPDLEFCALVQTRPNVFAMRSNIEGLKLAAIPNDQATVDRFDVFILGDLDSSYIRANQQELLIKRIREGAGLVMLGGYHSLGPGGYAGTPLGNILPVELGGKDIGQVGEQFLPVLTPDGTRHPIFANIADFFPTRQGEPKLPGLPRLDGCTRVEGRRPGATVLAAGAAEQDAMPVLAVQPLDRGRVAIFCGDTTRNWQQGPRAQDRESPFLRFWGQMVRWLAGRASPVAAGPGVTASADKAAYEPGESVRVSAVVRDKEGQAAGDATVLAKVRGPGGRPDQVTLAPLAGMAGHYAATIEPKETGAYEIVVEAQTGGVTLAADKISLDVGRANLEYERLDLDEKMLARIAADTGGRYTHITTADRLIEQLDRSQRKKSVYIERQLYWPPACWAVFVVVLTMEWVLRRRMQLR